MAKIQQKQIEGGSLSGGLITEVLSVTDTNGAITPLTGTPIGKLFMLFVNGVCYTPFVKYPAFSLNNQTLSWNSTNAGFVLELADSLVAIYTSSTNNSKTTTYTTNTTS